jgi:hypothetical protein
MPSLLVHYAIIIIVNEVIVRETARNRSALYWCYRGKFDGELEAKVFYNFEREVSYSPQYKPLRGGRLVSDEMYDSGKGLPY